MLLIVELFARGESFPLEALDKVDSALTAIGFKKEVRSVVKPRKEFSVTYDGPNLEKSEAEKAIQPVADTYGISFSVELEESVKFP